MYFGNVIETLLHLVMLEVTSDAYPICLLEDAISTMLASFNAVFTSSIDIH